MQFTSNPFITYQKNEDLTYTDLSQPPFYSTFPDKTTLIATYVGSSSVKFGQEWSTYHYFKMQSGEYIKLRGSTELNRRLTEIKPLCPVPVKISRYGTKKLKNGNELINYQVLVQRQFAGVQAPPRNESQPYQSQQPNYTPPAQGEYYNPANDDIPF